LFLTPLFTCDLRGVHVSAALKVLGRVIDIGEKLIALVFYKVEFHLGRILRHQAFVINHLLVEQILVINLRWIARVNEG
jgi:hypothetical protein